MSQRFTACLGFTLSFEGGFSNHPADPGGATMRGITQRVYDSYRDLKGIERQSVRLIAEDELQAIYRDGYWNLCFCDQLPAPVDLAVFDAAVNVGPGRSVKWLQRVVGATEDGIIGPGTLAAIARMAPPLNALELTAIRRAYYERIGGPFLNGWLNRLDALERRIVADVSVHPAPTISA